MEYRDYIGQQRSARLEAEANRILKSGMVGRQDALQGSKEKPFVVTTGWIKANATPAGGYKAEQLKLIGVRYPLASGWMGTAYGRAISEADRLKFESYHHGHDATKKSKALLAAGVKVGKDSGEFGRTECQSGYLVDCDCDVLPWEDCEHSIAASDRQAAAEMTARNLF
jgi:hypothetical protein